MATLRHLPLEIIMIICQYLPPKDIASCRLISAETTGFFTACMAMGITRFAIKDCINREIQSCDPQYYSFPGHYPILYYQAPSLIQHVRCLDFYSGPVEESTPPPDYLLRLERPSKLAHAIQTGLIENLPANANINTVCWAQHSDTWTSNTINRWLTMSRIIHKQPAITKFCYTRPRDLPLVPLYPDHIKKIITPGNLNIKYITTLWPHIKSLHVLLDFTFDYYDDTGPWRTTYCGLFAMASNMEELRIVGNSSESYQRRNFIQMNTETTAPRSLSGLVTAFFLGNHLMDTYPEASLEELYNKNTLPQEEWPEMLQDVVPPAWNLDRPLILRNLTRFDLGTVRINPTLITQLLIDLVSRVKYISLRNISMSYELPIDNTVERTDLFLTKTNPWMQVFRQVASKMPEQRKYPTTTIVLNMLSLHTFVHNHPFKQCARLIHFDMRKEHIQPAEVEDMSEIEVVAREKVSFFSNENVDPEEMDLETWLRDVATRMIVRAKHSSLDNDQ